MAEEESRVERRLDLPGERTALVVRVVIADPSDAHQVQLREEQTGFLVLRGIPPLAIAQRNEFENEVLSVNDIVCVWGAM